MMMMKLLASTLGGKQLQGCCSPPLHAAKKKKKNLSGLWSTAVCSLADPCWAITSSQCQLDGGCRAGGTVTAGSR